MSLWDIVVPETTTNKVKNPTGAGSANHTAAGSATVTVQSTTYSYLGAYSVRVQTAATNEGDQVTLDTLANAIHYVTVRVRGTLPSAWDWSLNGSTYNAPSLLSTEGDWSVYGFEFPAAQANASVRLDIYQNGAGSGDFYLGHIQAEAKAYATTPVTGDLDGCFWHGGAHKSASERPAWVRSGGRVYDLATQYSYYISRWAGTGVPDLTLYEMDLALQPGGLHEGYKVESRNFVLRGEQSGSSWENMHSLRKDLLSDLSPDLVKDDQPVSFRYRGALATHPIEIKGRLSPVNDFNEYRGFAVPTPLLLHANDPYWYDVHDSSFHLTTSSSISNADYILRKNNGTWANISTDFNATVEGIEGGEDGLIYIAGNFTNVGDANGDYIVSWNPIAESLTSLSTGANARVRKLLRAPNGDIYCGGDFTDLGDVNGDRVAYWDVSAGSFASLAADIDNGSIYAFTFGLDGILYVGGSFINVVDANGDLITQWSGSAFSSMGSGISGTGVFALATHPNGLIYVGGRWTSAGGGSTNGLSTWDGTNWADVGSGVSGGATPEVRAIAISKSGLVYVGGNYTSIDGVTASNISVYNGTSFEPLGNGVDALVRGLFYDDDTGLLYAWGNFTEAGGLTLADSFAVWNGSSWAHLDSDYPGSPIGWAFHKIRNNIYIGYSTSGTATASTLNTVTNNGTARVYPKLHIKRSGGTSATIEWLKNETTGATVYMNYALLDGESLDINFDPQNPSVVSSMFGDRWDAVLRGSDFADFYLQPGSNEIGAYVLQVGTPTMTQYLQWRNAYDSLDGPSA